MATHKIQVTEGVRINATLDLWIQIIGAMVATLAGYALANNWGGFVPIVLFCIDKGFSKYKELKAALQTPPNTTTLTTIEQTPTKTSSTSVTQNPSPDEPK